MTSNHALLAKKLYGNCLLVRSPTGPELDQGIFLALGLQYKQELHFHSISTHYIPLSIDLSTNTSQMNVQVDKRSFLLPWACCWWQKPHTYTSTTQSRTPFAAGSLSLWIAPWLCIQSCCHQQKRKIAFTGRGEINDLHQERNEGSRSARIHREGHSALRVKMKISLTFLIPKPESAQMQINLNHITARNQLEFQTL